MRYLYYPGCSLKGIGRAYEESLLAVCEALEVQLEELRWWSCCGASAYMSVDEMQALTLAARNLALAEVDDGDVSLVTPCNGCYLALTKAQHRIQEYPDTIGAPIIEALKKEGLIYRGLARVRHPLDIFINDVGLEKLKAATKHPLEDVAVACYYGCQVVRPYSTFDDANDPQSMDKILKAMGAKPVAWPLKTRCCGGTLTGTIPEAGLKLCHILLNEAIKRGANMMATACPLCQFNVECHQDRIQRLFAPRVELPCVYFTQLMGRAMGIGERQLGLHRMMTETQPVALGH